MRLFTIELSDNDIANFKEYIEYMKEDPDNKIQNMESAIRALALVRLDDRLEQMRTVKAR